MRYLFVTILVLLIGFRASGNNEHPRILVGSSDKEVILRKVESQKWAKDNMEKMISGLEPYIQLHEKDPEWILSRYLMNRVPGKRYTDFYCDKDGTRLIGYGGDAPVPTVRVTTHKRPPMSAEGLSYRLPEIEEIIPYDTSAVMYLQTISKEDKWEWVDPQLYIGRLNGKINTLALESAVLYWLTGDSRYGKFAADILDQWAKGAYYQYPIEGACRAGFLCIQTLGDGQYENLILAYDFVYDYLHQNGYELSYYETVFDKIASTMAFRGYYNNNWYAAQTSTLVYAALALNDPEKRDYYLKYIFEEDYIDGLCGRYSFGSTVEKWLTPDGHWKEPGGYHTYPVTHLLKASFALENNGYRVFETYPAFFDASYVMLKYTFPNFQGSSFGDTGRPRQSPECLEIGIAMADKYNRNEIQSMAAAMDILLKDGSYKRENSGFFGLLCFVPELPEPQEEYTWDRSGKLDFARFYLQRNGTDKKHGLMYAVQGASYNHNHANGMSMELYGIGQVMAPDPGNGHNYEDPMHVRYYARWAAHNTVVADARSSSVPVVRGGGGMKNIGAVELASMEPLAGKKAVSDFCSFTDTRYVDISTETNQQRTLAVIRTSDTTGYYLDIYRSDHPRSNQYLYHNIGDNLELSDTSGSSILTRETDFPYSEEDIPGFRKISGYKTTGKRSDPIHALFSITEGENPSSMQVFMAGNKEREFMTALAPVSKTADPPYNRKPTPLLIGYQHGEAWTKPFIALYEPYAKGNKASVDALTIMKNDFPGKFTKTEVYNKDKSRQIIYQSTDTSLTYNGNKETFKGFFGVVFLKNQKPEHIYMGEGDIFSYDGYEIRMTQKGGAAISVTESGYMIRCNSEVEITVPASLEKNILRMNGQESSLHTYKKGEGTTFKLPPCEEAFIY